MDNVLFFLSSRGIARDGKRLEICTAGFEFESGHALLVRAWNSRGFTRSPGPTKNVFREVGFPRIKKKNVLFFFKEIRSTELILDDLGIPLSLEYKEDLLEIICYVSMLTKMPLESDHLLVCSVHCGL
jgi:hypothetical protein